MRCAVMVVAIGGLYIHPLLSAGQSVTAPAVTAIRAAAMIDVEGGTTVKNAVVTKGGRVIRHDLERQ